MKKYKFKLEPLLFQRQTKEELKQLKLVKEKGILRELQDILESAYLAYTEHKNAPLKHNMSTADIQLHRNFFTVLQERLDKAKEDVRKQSKVIKEIQKELLELHKQTQIVEIIKDKDMEKYKEEVKKQETYEMDEFTSIRLATKIVNKQK